MKILIVEDDALVAKALIRMVSSFFTGCEFIYAENGAEGLIATKGKVLDLVITDINMPVMNGLEMVKLLRGQGHTIPILVMTAGVGLLQQEMLELNQAGIIQGMFDKPWKISTVTALIEKAIMSK